MIKPKKPTKPKKPRLSDPARKVVETFYVYNVSKWRAPAPGAALEHLVNYEFVKDDMVPMVEEDGDSYPDGDYDKVEGIDLPVLLKLLEERNIAIEDVVVDNEVYYRKCNGQLVLHVSKQLSDADYQGWVDGNAAKLESYQEAKDKHPALLESYKQQKKLWDIHQAELKLQALKEEG